MDLFFEYFSSMYIYIYISLEFLNSKMGELVVFFLKIKDKHKVE